MRALATDLTPSGTRRLCRCHTCETPCSATRAPGFFARRPADDTIMLARKLLRGRGDLAGLSFGLGVTEETGGGGRRRAAPQAAALNRPLLRARPVTQGHRDELGHWSERTQACETAAAGESGPDSADGRPWGWSRLAPAWRVLRAALVGPRPLDTAQEVVATPKARGAGLPACLREGVTWYLAARSAACPVGTTGGRPGQRGRPRPPRGAPQPALVSGPVVPQKQPGKRRPLSPRVVLGAERLPHLGLPRSTALVARVPLPWRQALAPWVRQTSSFCQDRARLRQRGVLCQGFSTMARPPMRLRHPWPPHERPGRGVLPPRWRERTPVLAAGLTEHVWTLRELLTATCEPWDSQSISG